MKRLKLFESFKSKKYRETHDLSGVALIVENKILLVHAKKHTGQINKWSIPKGHVEGNSLKSALKELKEETGIILDENFDDIIVFDYIKGGVKKIMDVYVYHREKSEVNHYLINWKIKPFYYDKNEIIDAKFFNLETTSRRRIDPSMIKLIDKLLI